MFCNKSIIRTFGKHNFYFFLLPYNFNNIFQVNIKSNAIIIIIIVIFFKILFKELDFKEGEEIVVKHLM